ncbi:hypothetical protein BBP00_00006710 [Phytophthora kernoviae]|uniref:Small ribosomal subunit protein mS23 n=1 Tax=Phytophthora kernoviae TaxID=325452 RepID=A0A3F2RKC5_9STRA|nr:hypothetical protein BBP00_00006710 [Phytophthora kernoviae]
MGRARKRTMDMIRLVKGLSRNGGMRKPSWVAQVDRYPPPPMPRADREKIPVITFPQDRLAELYMKKREGMIDNQTAYEFADEQLTLIEHGVPEEDAYNLLIEKYDDVESHRFLEKFSKMRGLEFADPKDYDDIEKGWVEAESRAIKEAMRLEHEEEEALRNIKPVKNRVFGLLVHHHSIDLMLLSPILLEKLNEVLSRFDALEAILVCTSEGVPLLKVSAEEKSELSYEYTETVLPTVFAGAAEQVGKLKFGAVQSVTVFYDDVVMIHINHAPLVITLVAPNSPHIGALHALASELRPALTPLKKCVESADVH